MKLIYRNVLICTAAGLLFFYLLRIFWGYFPDINPIFKGLLSCCAGSVWFSPVIHGQDILVNILLCLPLAYLIRKLEPQVLWLYLTSAVLPSFVFYNYHLFTPAYSGWTATDFAFGWSVQLLCLPIALALFLIRDRVRHD